MRPCAGAQIEPGLAPAPVLAQGFQQGWTQRQITVETTERYLGCKQNLNHSVNDNLGLEDT